MRSSSLIFSSDHNVDFFIIILFGQQLQVMVIVAHLFPAVKTTELMMMHQLQRREVYLCVFKVVTKRIQVLLLSVKINLQNSAWILSVARLVGRYCRLCSCGVAEFLRDEVILYREVIPASSWRGVQ